MKVLSKPTHASGEFAKKHGIKGGGTTKEGKINKLDVSQPREEDEKNWSLLGEPLIKWVHNFSKIFTLSS